MNCRPNDLARVIAPGRLVHCPLCSCSGVAVRPDTIVRVTQHDGIAWALEEPICDVVPISCGATIIIRCRMLPDELLRPIRDPGDDAVDEMVAKLGPAPMTLTEVREVTS